MAEIIRRSPVHFDARPVRTQERQHYPVVLEFDGEGPGPYLVDLSHKTRWDLQSPSVVTYRPADAAVPEKPGQCALGKTVLINRMNRTQAAVWHLDGAPAGMPEDSAYTDVSESTVFLALFGPKAFFITEKLTSLDFMDPNQRPPYLLQGPMSHVPCQIAVLEKKPGGAGGILFTCSRGYAHCMTHAVLDAGAEFGLRPAGEDRFTAWLAGLAA